MKLKHFQAPALFSSTFKVLNLREQNSSTFKDAREPCISDILENFSRQNFKESDCCNRKKLDSCTEAKSSSIIEGLTSIY